MSGPVPAARAVENTMFKALALLRVIVMINAIAITWYQESTLVRPGAAVLIIALLIAWTGLVIWLYSQPQRRQLPLMITDLVIAIAAISASPWVKGSDFQGTLPGFWVMAPVLCWASRYGWHGGLFSAMVVAGVDLSIRLNITLNTYGNIFLLLLGGPLVGFLGQLLKDMAKQRELAERSAAAASERARLARVVHDGVLQVLALVQRRCSELGGEAAELGALAGEQEVALRSLVQREDPAYGQGSGTDQDLASMVAELERRTTPTVSVAVPGGEVVTSTPVAEELIAVVRACLHNVSDHVGPQAPAWVFLEDLGDDVQVTVRDSGPGIEPGRLEEARREGRLGVSESIQGRILGLGGSVELHSAPGQGTEWEFRVPKWVEGWDSVPSHNGEQTQPRHRRTG